MKIIPALRQHDPDGTAEIIVSFESFVPPNGTTGWQSQDAVLVLTLDDARALAMKLLRLAAIPAKKEMDSVLDKHSREIAYAVGAHVGNRSQ